MAQSGIESEWRPSDARRWTEREGQAMVERWRRSGLSQSEFARQYGVDGQRVHYWIRRTTSDRPPCAPAVAAVTFAPVRVVGEVAGDREATPAPRSAPTLEVVVGGAVVRVGREFDETHLRRVVSALGGLGC